jgi:hypothetical protein
MRLRQGDIVLIPVPFKGGRSGGCWDVSGSNLSASDRLVRLASADSACRGFRLASPVAVPEPSTWVMGLTGIACGGWQMYRRRRARA